VSDLVERSKKEHPMMPMFVALLAVLAITIAIFLPGCVNSMKQQFANKPASNEAGAAQVTSTAADARAPYQKSSSKYQPRVFMRAMNELERPENYHSYGYQYSVNDKFFFDASEALSRMIENHQGNVRAAAIRYLNAVNGRIYDPEAQKAYDKVLGELKKAKVAIPKKYLE
jgi:hypothetical protein